MPTEQRADDQEDDSIDQASQFSARVDVASRFHSAKLYPLIERKHCLCGSISYTVLGAA